ncbi:MAG: phage shock protein [Pseudonocardiales bacterium]|nr:phage shock protein [Pseudonocardiales bacterium]
MTAPVPSHRLRRSRTDALLGGVCAGVARSAGLDPLLLRIAVVAVTVLTGGAGAVAYLAAWVLIPREPLHAAPLSAGADRPGPPLHAVGGGAPGEATGTGAGSGADVRAAWTAVGNDLRSLTTELRRPASASSPATGNTTGTGMPGSSASHGTASDSITPDDRATTGAAAATAGPPSEAIPTPRSPLDAADDAATALGERLRTPEVQEGARRAATSMSQAVTASVDELARRVRRERD